MVQIIPRAENFGDLLSKGIGEGFTKGMSQASDFASQMKLERQKNAMRQQTINQIEGQQASASQNFQKQFFEALPEVENQIGRKLTAEDVNTLWSKVSEGQGQSQGQQDPFLKAKQYAAAGEHDLSRVASEEAKGQQKNEALIQKEQRAEERDRSSKILNRVATSKENLIQRRADLAIAKNAIEQNPGDIGSVKNYVAESFGITPLKTASAAAFSAGVKDAYVQGLRGLARPNQWIEQQIKSATASIGLSDEANLSLLEIGDFKLDLEDQFNSLVDELEDKDIQEYGRVKGDIGKRAEKLLKPYAEQRQKQLAYDLKVLNEKEKGDQELSKLKEVTKGTPLTTKMAQVILSKVSKNIENPTEEELDKALNVALNLGYTIPEEEIYQRNQ